MLEASKKNYDYARDLFQRLITANPDDAKAREALRAVMIRKLQERGAPRKSAVKGRFEVLIRTSKAPLKKADLCLQFLLDDPTNSKVRGILAETLLLLGHNNGAAVEARMALESAPSDASAAKTLVCKATGRAREAKAIIERLSS